MNYTVNLIYFVCFPPDHMWSWWTSCWSAGTRWGCGSPAGYGGSASKTGGRFAAASVMPAHSTHRTLCRTQPPRHQPCPGLSMPKGPCSSPPQRPNQRTGARTRSTVRPNPVPPRLKKRVRLLHKWGESRRGPDRVHTDCALISILAVD